ncbi:MAG: polyprenyl synthetase family protein [Thermoanaerobaculia bacterium]
MDYTLKFLKERIEEKLLELIPENSAPEIKEAMKYSLAAGGKRLRPLLLLSSLIYLNKNPLNFLEPACGLEFIHTYSLIHDDLPSMDNDTLRRGMPTCHIKFGEAIAILAGDSLLTHSFYIFSKYPENLSSEIKRRAVEMVSKAIGPEGLVAGQVMDLKKVEKEEDLILMHSLKTGKLIKLSCQLAGLYSEAREEEFQVLNNFGENFGILFQIVDDLLDELCTAEEMGKSPGKDKAQGKLTAYSLWGIEGSLKKIEDLKEKIFQKLSKNNEGSQLLMEIVQKTLSKVYDKIKK